MERTRTRATNPSRAEEGAPRFPSGKLRSPLGVREGGPAWLEMHARIAQAALRVLAESGYAAASKESVARAAGVATNTVYRHFATKAELAVAAIRELPTEAGWFDGQDSVEQRIVRASAIGAAYREYLVPVLATAIAHRNDAPELLDAIRDYVLIPRERVIADAVIHAKADGQMRTDIDPEVIAAWQLGALVASFVGIHPRGSAEDMAAYALEHLWPLLRAEPVTAHATPAKLTTTRAARRTK